MGPFEKKLREILSGVGDSEKVTTMVEEILEAHCDIYALYTMSQMMSAETEASAMSRKRSITDFRFNQGKIEAFQQLFIKVAFDGLSLEDGTLSDEDLAGGKDFWRKKVEAFIETTVGG